MTVAKITKSVVDRMGPGSLIWDTATPGFGARRQAQAVTYVVRYRLGNRQYIRKVGRHGVLTPDEARVQAKVILGDVAKGRSPDASGPLAKALHRYLERGRWRPRTRTEIERHLLRQVVSLHRMKLGDIDRRSIAGRSQIASRVSKLTADR